MQKLSLRLIAVIILCALVFLLMQQCSQNRNLRYDLHNAKNNAKALVDTLQQSTNKLGQIQYEKSILVSSSESLRELNNRLFLEMQATRGQVAQLVEIVGNIKIPLPPPIAGNGETKGTPCDSIGGTFTSNWESIQLFDSLNFRKLKAKTIIGVKNGIMTDNATEILQDEIGFNLITKLEKRKDHYEIVVRSDFPGFTPTRIDGAIIPNSDLYQQQIQKKKNFSVGIGPQIGLGYTGFKNNWQPNFYIGIGASFQYTIFRF